MVDVLLVYNVSPADAPSITAARVSWRGVMVLSSDDVFVGGVGCDVCVGAAADVPVELAGVDEEELATAMVGSSKDESSGAYCRLVVVTFNFSERFYDGDDKSKIENEKSREW